MLIKSGDFRVAKVVDTIVKSDNIANPSMEIWQVAFLGAVLGTVYWAIVTILDHFTNSATVPGDVATILAATVGILAMVHYRMTQPMITAVAVALSLWGMTYLTDGLSSGEMLIWSIVLYGMGYATFAWITRYTKVVPVLVIITLVIVIARLAASF